VQYALHLPCATVTSHEAQTTTRIFGAEDRHGTLTGKNNTAGMSNEIEDNTE
jgi:hypothetical protein